MNTKTTALLTAALLALSACSAATADNAPVADATPQPTALATAPTAGDMSEPIATALNSYDRSDPPGGLTAPDAAQAALDGARSAYVQGDIFLYIDSSGQLISRASDGETTLAQSVCALTHVDSQSAYVLVYANAGEAPTTRAVAGDSGQGEGWDDDAQGQGWDDDTQGQGWDDDAQGQGWDDDAQGQGWDDPIGPSGDSAPANGRELSAPCDWIRVALDGAGTQLLLAGVDSVPVISGGYAYATQAEAGGILRSDLNGDSALIYAPEAGCELKLSAGPQGAICALYDQGLLVGCCAIGADGAVAVHDWAAGAEFHDGYAVSYAPGSDGSGRAGLYLINASGELLLDAQARADYLCQDNTVYYWHADPEQSYGFCDLMACDATTGQTQPVAAAAQLRARLFAYGGTLYLTNYDSELYSLPDGATEPEYVLDLSVDYDFNSDLMPLVTLYGDADALGALIYLDEGDGYHLIGEITPEAGGG